MDSAPPLADEQFVSLTTYRRTGEGVATPMWVAADGEALVIWTPTGTGKIKRLRRDARVALQPCSRMGKVAPDAPRHEGTATVTEDPAALARTVSLLKRKYRVTFFLVTTIERVVRGRTPRSVVRITLD